MSSSKIRELSQLASVIVVDDSTKNVGIGSTLPGSKLSVTGDAYISGNTRIVGILSVGSGTITIDGDNGVIGVGTVTLTETQVSQLDDLTGDDGNFSGSVSIAGSITAGTFYGDGSNLTGVSANAISNVVEDATPQLGGNLDLNGSSITGSGDIDITGNIDVNGNLNVDGVLTYQDVTNVDSIGIVTARKGIVIESGYGVNVVSGVVTATTFDGNVTGNVTGTASNSSQLNSQSPSYYLNYNNFTNTPTIPSIVGLASEGYVDNLVAISTFSGDYNNLTNQPSIPSIVGLASEGYVDNLVAISTFSGDYNDLTNAPTIPTNNNQLTNGAGYITGITGESLGDLSDVSTSGATSGQVLAYNGTSWAPSSAGGSNADTLDSQLPSYYLDYNNFTNTPTIPTNNNQLTNGAGYITSADGGNAATLDGIDSSQFLRSDAADTASGRITFSANNDVLETSSGSQGSIEVYQNTAGADAFMAFHVAGDYAAYFGLKGDINDFAVGGWSMGNVYYKVWHAGNDGSGSGLDADKVDGYHFLQTQGISAVGNFGQWQAHNTYTNFNSSINYWGWNYVQGNTNAPNTSSSQWYRNRVSLGSEYGLNYSGGHYWLEMAYPRYSQNAAGHMWLRVCENGSVGSWTQVGSYIVGNFTATGNINSSSDIRLKTNIKTLTNSLDKVLQMRGVEYDRIDLEGNPHQIGVIAQEVEEVAPELVSESDCIKTVSYGNITALLIEAIKEQQKQIDLQKEQIDKLTRAIENLK